MSDRNTTQEIAMDLSRITSPLRLAVGSHVAGSGKGCALNVVSWINGDTTITDYPGCSARPLARLVQVVNDGICTHRVGDLLCPGCSQVVLDLALSTVGTAGVPDTVVWAWLAELLDSPEWGVIRHAHGDGPDAITRVANLCRRSAAGEVVGSGEWQEAKSAADAASRNDDATIVATAVATYAAAYAASRNDATTVATTVVTTVVTYAVVTTVVTYAVATAARLAHARQAITAWRRLAGLTAPHVAASTVDGALRHMAEVR